MRFVAIFTLFFSAMTVYAAPNPADYPLSLHVTASRLVRSASGNAQKLNVVVDGSKYVLMGNAISNSGKGVRTLHVGLMPVGDYKARLIKADYKPDYLLFLSYEILLPDRTSETFAVVGQKE